MRLPPTPLVLSIWPIIGADMLHILPMDVKLGDAYATAGGITAATKLSVTKLTNVYLTRTLVCI